MARRSKRPLEAVPERKTTGSIESEFGALRRLLIHYPDEGIGMLIPKKASESLYEDIVHLRQMQAEYDCFLKVVMAFVDIETLCKWFDQETAEDSIQGTKAPPPVTNSHVVDVQDLLADLLSNEVVRLQLVASICALAGSSYAMQQTLCDHTDTRLLARTLVTGLHEYPDGRSSSILLIGPFFRRVDGCDAASVSATAARSVAQWAVFRGQFAHRLRIAPR